MPRLTWYAPTLRADDDQKAKLTGHARLVLTVLDSSARVYLFKTEYEKLKAWQDSVRGTTDWEPPRMPDDLVKPVRL